LERQVYVERARTFFRAVELRREEMNN